MSDLEAVAGRMQHRYVGVVTRMLAVMAFAGYGPASFFRNLNAVEPMLLHPRLMYSEEDQLFDEALARWEKMMEHDGYRSPSTQ